MCVDKTKNQKLNTNCISIHKSVKNLWIVMLGGLCIISQTMESMAAESIQTNSNRHPSPPSKTKLRNTLWGQVAGRHGIDPYILYAVALTESRKNDGQNHVIPSPWAINNAGNTFIPGSQQEAKALLYQLMDQGHPIGAWQSRAWHRPILQLEKRASRHPVWAESDCFGRSDPSDSLVYRGLQNG